MDLLEKNIEAADGLIPIAHFDSLSEAQEYVLVILAMNLDCLIKVDEGKYLLHAESPFELAVREEFSLYQAEQKYHVPPPQIPVFSSGFDLFLVWATVLFFCYSSQVESPLVTERFVNSSTKVIGDGEIYLSFTALFLHGSMEHLLSNVALGGLFCILVAHSLGPWTGWVLIFLSGFLANLANAALHFGTQFSSLGASSATFGALGLLVGVGLYQAWLARTVRSGFRVLAPLGIGLMLFSMWGIGDGSGHIDVTAHLLGLGFGTLIGLPASWWKSRRVLASASA